MAREIVQYVWCDKHMDDGERREAETIIVRIGDNDGELDLCVDCRQTYVTPLAALLTIHAKPVTTTRAKDIPAKATPSDGTRTRKNEWWRDHARDPIACPICGQEVARAYSSAHLDRQHQSSLSEVYGVRCPLDGYVAGSFQGLATHFNKGHGRGIGAHGVTEMAREAGDPLGIVAEIDKRIELIRQNVLIP